MVQSWAVTFLDNKTKRVRVDTFGACTAGEARRSFNECYRHGDYTILSAVPVPGTELKNEDTWGA